MYALLFLAVSSSLIALLLTPLVRNVFAHAGLVDEPDRARKTHTRPVPRVGGIPIVIAALAAIALLDLSPLPGGPLFSPLAWKLIPAALLVFTTGLVDDLVGLRPAYKLAGQLVAAGLTCWAGVRFTLASHAMDPCWTVALTLVWLIACTNAFNLIDGVDGLATGVGLFATLTTLLAALLQANYALAIATVPLAGALAGFMRYNFNPASIFLGDSGSLTIGFVLGCYGIIWSQKSATLLGMTAPLMALAIPLVDTGLAIVRRFLRGQPICAADRGHIHHRLLARGLTPRRVALLLYGVSGIAATFALLQSVAGNRFAGAVIVLFCAAAWIGVQHLGYIELGMARRLIVPGTFLRVLNAQLRLNALEDELAASQTAAEWWRALREAAREFGFRRVMLSAPGAVYDESFDSGKAGEFWTVDIPLSDSAFVRLFRPFEAPSEPTMMASLAGVLRRSMSPKLAAFEAPPRKHASPRRSAGDTLRLQVIPENPDLIEREIARNSPYFPH